MCRIHRQLVVDGGWERNMTAITMLRLITSCYIRLYSLPNSTEKANNKAYVLVLISEGLF
jgi:hypothetical protein